MRGFAREWARTTAGLAGAVLAAAVALAAAGCAIWEWTEAGGHRGSAVLWAYASFRTVLNYLLPADGKP